MMLSERITESRVEHTQNMENDFLLQIAVKALTKSELMAVLLFREVAMAAGEWINVFVENCSIITNYIVVESTTST